ncbi:hypothetical protein Vi05172_g4336 [Venturia inaequalis]|nr:hypothetical protein Vi05172_g4336 [Venturia inaequalis]
MKFLPTLFLLTPFSAALATTPTLNDDPTPILLAPRQVESFSNVPGCIQCARNCEAQWGKPLPGKLPSLQLCGCLSDCEKNISGCLIVYHKC